jgi:hypothetical protein
MAVEGCGQKIVAWYHVPGDGPKAAAAAPVLDRDVTDVPAGSGVLSVPMPIPIPAGNVAVPAARPDEATRPSVYSGQSIVEIQ